MALELWRPKGGLTRHGPARDFAREMENAFDRFFRGWSLPWSSGDRGWAPPVDMVDRKNEIVVGGRCRIAERCAALRLSQRAS